MYIKDVNNVIFKRVAVVEYFFHIIYKVHCSVGVGERRHVGQKRTYRKVCYLFYYFNLLLYSLLIYFYAHNLFQITEYYSFLPREAVTKFLSQCHDCRKSMKTNLTLDIVDTNDHHDNSNNEAFKSSNNQLSFLASGLKEESEDYPRNIENYYLLLKALYENSSMLSRIKDDPIHEHSCEKKFESFKENIIANQINNNEIPNQQLLLLQQQQHIYRKNVNINIKNDSDRNSMKDIVINSLDVSINVASKPTTTNNYGNVKILCSTTTPSTKLPTPPTTPSPQSSPSFTSISLPSMLSDNQDIHLVTSSGSAEDDEEMKIKLIHDTAVTSAADIAADSISNEKNTNIFTSNNANSSNSNPTRAVRNNHGVENFRCYAIPDDMSFDYHNIKNYYNDKTTTSSSLSNTKNYQAPTLLRTICDDDYHHGKEMPSIDITKHNKHHNNSTNIKPITSTYLRLTRSWGIWDEDALNLVSNFFYFIFYFMCGEKYCFNLYLFTNVGKDMVDPSSVYKYVAVAKITKSFRRKKEY